MGLVNTFQTSDEEQEAGCQDQSDQESPDGPDRNLPSFSPGEQICENCDAQENDMEDDLLPSDDDESSSLSESYSYHPVNPRSPGSPNYRSSTREPQRHCVPSSVQNTCRRNFR
jgi:hypothetical protein